MAEKTGSVWAVISATPRLRPFGSANESGSLEVTGFEHIQHQKVLAGSGIKEQEKAGAYRYFASPVRSGQRDRKR